MKRSRSPSPSPHAPTPTPTQNPGQAIDMQLEALLNGNRALELFTWLRDRDPETPFRFVIDLFTRGDLRAAAIMQKLKSDLDVELMATFMDGIDQASWGSNVISQIMRHPSLPYFQLLVDFPELNLHSPPTGSLLDEAFSYTGQHMELRAVALLCALQTYPREILIRMNDCHHGEEEDDSYDEQEPTLLSDLIDNGHEEHAPLMVMFMASLVRRDAPFLLEQDVGLGLDLVLKIVSAPFPCFPLLLAYTGVVQAMDHSAVLLQAQQDAPPEILDLLVSLPVEGRIYHQELLEMDGELKGAELVELEQAIEEKGYEGWAAAARERLMAPVLRIAAILGDEKGNWQTELYPALWVQLELCRNYFSPYLHYPQLGPLSVAQRCLLRCTVDEPGLLWPAWPEELPLAALAETHELYHAARLASPSVANLITWQGKGRGFHLAEGVVISNTEY